MWGFLWLISAFMAQLVPLVSEGSLRNKGRSLGVIHVFFVAPLGILFAPWMVGPIVEGWLYGVSHVFSASMALLVPLWCRLSLGPMREEGGSW